MANSNQTDFSHIIRMEEFLSVRGLIDCRRYHARLTSEACRRYRKRKPDLCRGCQNHLRPGRQRIWTREKILQALVDYGKDRIGSVTVQEFKDEFGVNSDIIKREWGYWRSPCDAAGVQAGRCGKPIGDVTTSTTPANQRITVDLGDLPDLYEALNEEAQRNGRELEEQIISILKGWFA